MTGWPRTCLGVELTDRSARAVATRAFTGTVAATAEVPFDPAHPEACVDALRAHFGNVSAIAIGIGYAHLYFSHVHLPPVGRAERVAILAQESDRFFPVSTPVAVAMIGDELACAADAGTLAQWIVAFQRWSSVAAVLPAPVVTARLFGERTGRTGLFALPEDLAGGERAVVELSDGHVVGVRRMPAGAALSAEVRPAAGDAGSRFATAAALASLVSTPPSAQLLPLDLRKQFDAARTRRLSAAVTGLALSFAFAAWAFDHSRARVLEQLTAQGAVLADSAAPAIALRDRLAALARSTDTAGASQPSTDDPLGVLAALSERLPADATVIAIAADGDGWKMDGRAVNAAGIVPALDADARFREVHLAGPTTRFMEGTRSVESFSIAFRSASTR